LRIWQFPVTLGTGKRLFGEGTIPRSFRLADTQLNTTGAVLHVYERVGGLTYGEVEVGQETVVFDSGAAHERRTTRQMVMIDRFASEKYFAIEKIKPAAQEQRAENARVRRRQNVFQKISALEEQIKKSVAE
jgi:hypothetical protein